MRLDHDALERPEVRASAEEAYLAGRAVQDMIDLPAWCFSRCSGHGSEGTPARRLRSIRAASPFLVQAASPFLVLQDMIDLPAWCFSRCSGHRYERTPARRLTSI